jgi:PAS domain S-box-containing protein
MTQGLLASEILAKIIDGSPIALFVINKQHEVVYWNTASEALSGIKMEEIIGTGEQWRAFYTEKRPVMADLIVDGASADEIEAYYQGKCKKSSLIDDAYEAEDFFPSLGKHGKWLHFTASPIRDNNGKVIAAIETLEDTTERKNAEEALHESERSFRALFEDAYDAIWVHDLEGNIQTVNKAAAELSGYPKEELMRMNVRSFLSAESLNLSREVKDKLTQHQRLDAPYELRIIKKDGSEATWMVTSNLITSDGEPKGFQNIARDVSQEKRMRENLRYYLHQITKAQEEERKRIARELHDDMAQVLGSLSRQLDNFIRKKHGFAPNEVLFLRDLQAQLNRGVQVVHRLVQDLRPSLLDDLGLTPALRSLTKSLQESEGIVTDLEVSGGERRLSPEVELLLFRIVQEALSNIRRHAQASEAQVAIDFTENRVKLTISDNGRGFELSGRVDEFPRSGKLGLAGMQERAQLLGGTLEVKSKPGKGTTLIVEVPS